MATSGSFQTVFSTGYALHVSWTESNVNVAANTSDITVTATLKSIKGTYYINSTATKNISLTINGATYSSTCTVGIEAQSSKTLFTKTVTGIAHDSSTGAKSVAISCTLGIKVTLNDVYVSSVAASGTAALTTIPRVSTPTLSASSVELGKTLTIYTNRASTSFTHKLQYGWYGTQFYDITSNITDSYVWTVPLTFANNIPDAVEGWGTIRCITYNGSAVIGTKDVTFKGTVPASMKPTAALQVLDATDIKDTYGNLVKGLSKLYIKVTGTRSYGSDIVTWKATADGSTYSKTSSSPSSSVTAAEFTTGLLKNAGTVTVAGTVVDKRNRPSSEASASFTVLDYYTPSISKLAVHRCDADGTENDSGANVKVTFSSKVAALSNKNAAKYSINYVKSSDGTAGSVAASSLPGSTTYSVTDHECIFAADDGSSYEITLTVSDNHGSVSKTTSASTGYTLLHFGSDGRSIGIGKISENTDTMDVAMALRTEQGITNVQNGITNRIYSPNTSYTWYSTTAKHYFNTDVHVKGNIYGGSNYQTKVVLAGETVAKSTLSVEAESLTSADTRSTNQTPSWYITTYGRGSVYEFKETDAIGFTDASSTYCSLNTIIPYQDTSGGLPQQYAFFNGEMWKRTGSSATAWGAWRAMLDNASTIDADTLGGQALAYCYNYCEKLYSGSLATSASTTVALDSKYSGYVVMGKTSSSSAVCSIFIPRWNINTTRTLYQFADEANYVSFYVSHNGTNVTIARQNQSNSGSTIIAIMGVS